MNSEVQNSENTRADYTGCYTNENGQSLKNKTIK